VDRDLFKIPPSEIWKIKVEQTWVGGKRVYARSGSRKQGKQG
jgi:predicted amidohydrolase YtcJ